jgi:predicted nucleic acid-binding protein
MIVIDASALIPILVNEPPWTKSATGYLAESGISDLAAPHLVDLEITNALRNMVERQELSEHVATGALEELQSIRLHRYPHAPFLGRVWELRQNLTAYDAAYVALAETLEVPLLTRDRAMAISQTSAEVVVID